MSKSRSFFGLRSGSTKNFTFTVDNGKQVTKEHADFVKNPRTPQQMVNRLLMATTTAAYSGLKEIVDHSFEGVQYGRESMAEFIRRNYAMLRQDAQSDTPAAAYNPYRDRALLPNAYVISKGSALPILASNLSFTFDGEYHTIMIDGETADKLMRKLNVAVGDVVTIVILGILADDADNASCEYAYIRLKFKQSGTVVITEANYQDYLDVDSNQRIYLVKGNEDEGFFKVVFEFNLSVDSKCFLAAIHSVETANGWLRSDAVLTKNSEFVVNASFADALATYPKGKAYLLNGAPL